MLETYEDEERAVEMVLSGTDRIRAELSKTIVGQEQVIEELLISLFSGGHCLLTGAPGLAKTLLVRSLASVFRLSFQRIQFTPDLMPADITGTEVLRTGSDGERSLQFLHGPIFANVLLADEINRTPPKTQAALLESMQEHQVTVAGQRYPLELPFFVLATQNPIEMEGTYPLPEAQLDRFMFNVLLDYLPLEDEVRVVARTTGPPPESIEPWFDGADILRIHELVRRMPVAEDIVRYAVRLCVASRPGREDTPDFVNEWVAFGAGTRAAQFLVLGAKARALIQGRTHAGIDDVKQLAHATLRHRLLIGYRAEAEGVAVEQVIDRLLETVEVLP